MCIRDSPESWNRNRSAHATSRLYRALHSATSFALCCAGIPRHRSLPFQAERPAHHRCHLSNGGPQARESADPALLHRQHWSRSGLPSRRTPRTIRRMERHLCLCRTPNELGSGSPVENGPTANGAAPFDGHTRLHTHETAHLVDSQSRTHHWWANDCDVSILSLYDTNGRSDLALGNR